MPAEASLEAALIAAWSECLPSAVDAHTDFFAAGGDSFSALEIACTAGEILSLSDAQCMALVEAIFDFPTPRALAEFLRGSPSMTTIA